MFEELTNVRSLGSGGNQCAAPCSISANKDEADLSARRAPGPIYATAQDRDTSINFHVGSSSMDGPAVIMEPMLQHLDANMAARGTAIGRMGHSDTIAAIDTSDFRNCFPQLSFVSVVRGFGLIPCLVESLDRYANVVARNCFSSCCRASTSLASAATSTRIGRLRRTCASEGTAMQSRLRTHTTLTAIAVGTMVVGLLLPFVWGKRIPDQTLGARDAGAQIAETNRGDSGSGGAVTPDALAADGDGIGSSVGINQSSSSLPGGSTKSPGGSTGQTEPTPAGKAGGTVRIGVLLLNIGNIASFGFGGGSGLSVRDQQTVWQGYIDDVNNAGGIHGRKIEAIYEPYDVLSPDDMRRACLALTQDAKVFAVADAGGYTGPSVLCVTKENRRPFILSASSGVPDEYYRQSGRLLFTLFQAGGRSMANLAAELGSAGVKKTMKVGILSDLYGGIKETPDQLQAALERERYEVVFRGDLSGDLQTGTTQIPVTVQQMRARGVEVVVNISNAVYATQFVQEASNQGWRPQYVGSDWNGGTTDFYNQNMPASYDGSRTVTITRINEGRTGRPQPATDAACQKRAEVARNTTVPRDTDAYGQYVRICSIVTILRRGLEEAGPQLSVDTFVGGTQQIGRMQLAGFGGGSYVPGRPDAADNVRTMRWSASCTCSLPVDDFRPTKN